MSPPSRKNEWLSKITVLLGFALAYAACVELGHWLSFSVPNRAEYFATFWPPSGLLLATLLLTPRRDWPWLMSAGFVAEISCSLLLNQRPLGLCLAISATTQLEAVFGAWLVQQLVANPFTLRRTTDVLGLIACSAILCTGLGAIIPSTTMVFHAQQLPLLETWYRWWIRDMLGVIVVAPLLLAWLPYQSPRNDAMTRRCLEASVLFLVLTILSWLVYCFQPNFARAFLLFPLLIYAAMRFGLKGATSATAVIALFAIYGTTRGTGVFAAIEPTSIMSRSENLQVFLAAASLTSLLFATSFAERIQSDLTQKHHLELLNAVLEGTTDAVFVKDMKGHYLMINSAGAKFLGKSVAEVIGKDDTDLFTPESAKEIRDNDKRIMHGGKTVTIEETVTSDNQTRTYLATKGPYRDARGELSGLLGISRDITEYRQAELSLQESENRFKQMANTIPEIFWLRQVEPFRFLYVSPAYERITGKSCQSLYENPLAFLDIIHPDDRQYMIDLTNLEVTEPMEGACRAVVPNGDVRYLRLYFSPVRDESGKIHRTAGIAVDVTELTLIEQAMEVANKDLERRVTERTAALTEANEKLELQIAERTRAEDRLQEQQAQLAHVSRLSTIGEMAAELAHEINQPLSAIGNYIFGTLHTIKVGDVVNQELISTLRQLQIESGRAANIIRRVRNFTRRGEPQKEEVSLNDSVKDVFRLTSAEARHRRIELKVKLDENLPKLLVDRLQIEQVVVNLVRNAFDAIQEAGGETRWVILETCRNGDFVELAVHDNGPGIPEDKREKIFEPFFTTKHDGLGLGLAISRSIVEAHQGRLWAENRSPRGTTFRISLPVAQGLGPCNPTPPLFMSSTTTPLP